MMAAAPVVKRAKVDIVGVSLDEKRESGRLLRRGLFTFHLRGCGVPLGLCFLW